MGSTGNDPARPGLLSLGVVMAMTVAALAVVIFVVVALRLAIGSGSTAPRAPLSPSAVGQVQHLTVGNGTKSVAVSPDGATLYVGLYPSTTAGQAAPTGGVAIVDAASGTVEATVPVPAGVLGVAVTPDGARVLATASNADVLVDIDTATRSVRAQVPVGQYPQGVAILPDGRTAYVVDYTDDNVSTVDLTADQVTATTPVGTGPGELGVSPDGRRVLVGNQNDSTVSAVDPVDVSASSEPTEVGPGAGHVAFSADSRTAYVTLSDHGFGDGGVVALDMGTGAARPVYRTDRVPFGFAAGGDRLYVSFPRGRGYPTGDLVIVDPHGGTPRTIPIGPDPAGLALSPDGRLLYAVDGGSTISIVRVAPADGPAPSAPSQPSPSTAGTVTATPDACAADSELLAAYIRTQTDSPQGVAVVPGSAHCAGPYEVAEIRDPAMTEQLNVLFSRLPLAVLRRASGPVCERGQGEGGLPAITDAQAAALNCA